ncbi:hypothetical protein N7475_009563 [Penicillium sp. IBT 31633x]|nr:hypothetical protein N7475_009563 [Penicillium sp. IBT 31633x]
MGDNAHEVVDLTASTPRRNPIHLSSSPPTAFDASSSSHRRQPATSRGVKRGNNEDGEPSASSPGPPNHIPIRMDLTEAASVQEAAPKRFRNRLRSYAWEHNPFRATHHRDPPRSNPLLAYRCPICLERPINPTSAFCGHVFCHKCIWDHLEFSSQSQSHDSSKKSKGTCPVCRTPISRSNSGKSRGITPIIFQTEKREDPPPTS